MELISKFTKGPAEVLGIQAGTLAEGSCADITIFDPDKEYTIDSSTFYSKGRNTPFNEWEVKGQVAAAIVDGKAVYSKIKGLTGKI